MDSNQGFNRTELSPKKANRPISFWLAIIFGIFLGASVVINFILLFALVAEFTPISISESKSKLFEEKFINGDANAPDKILVIPVNGVIMSGENDSSFWSNKTDPVQYIINTLKHAESDSSIKVIILAVNSPGGGITACDQIHTALRRFKKNHPNIVLMSCMKDVAASGGYYISAATDHIFAYHTTITGSIGVISTILNLEGLFNNIGLQMETIKSADKKDIGSAFRQMTDEEREILQNIINEMYQRFINVVVGGRPKLTREEILTLADGRIYTGEQALKNGLVDELGNEDDVYESAKKLAKISNAKIIEYKKRWGFWEIFETASQKFQPAESLESSIKNLILGRNTPQLLYLWVK